MNNYFLIIEALASSAIEGNELAEELLQLKKTDHDEFVRKLYEYGFLEQAALKEKETKTPPCRGNAAKVGTGRSR